MKFTMTIFAKQKYFIKIFLPFILLNLLCLNVFSQNINQYSERYRYYRERFNKYFIYVGPNPGESLPITARTWKNILWTDDMPDHIGWYLGMLATEYYLTKDAGGNVDSLIKELHYALYAVNRLDQTEAGIGNTALDGFYIREDFPADFLASGNQHELYLNKGLPYPGDDQLLTVTTHNGMTIDLPTDPNRAAMSMDHNIRILMGLALIKKFVDENASYATFQDGKTSIQQEAIAIADRIITYMKNGRWFIWMPATSYTFTTPLSVFIADIATCFKLFPLQLFDPFSEPCTNCPILFGGGAVLAPRGCSPFIESYGFAKAGAFITGNNYNDIITAADYPFWFGSRLAVPIYLSTSALKQALMLAAIGDSWEDPTTIVSIPTQFYIDALDIIYHDWRVYTLLHSALHDKTPLLSINDSKILLRLDNAPCIGPNRLDNYWFDNNMFDRKEISNPGGGWSHETYNGLDYMLFYNLWYINFKNQLPSYTTTWLRFNNGTDAVITNTDITLVQGNIDFPYNITGCSFCPFSDIGTDTHPVEVLATSTITASDEINADATVTFHAGEDIFLEPDFEVHFGAEWNAYTTPVECDGGLYKSLNQNGKPDVAVPLSENLGASNNSEPQNDNYVPQIYKYDSLKISIKNSKPDSTTVGSAISKSKNIQTLSGNANSKAIVITPNPTTGRTVIYFSPEQITSATARLEITDIVGQKVFEKNPFGQGVANYLDLSHLHKGVYFLKISTEDEVRVEKVVIE